MRAERGPSREELARARGDIVRVADLNTQEPGREEVGLFAVPIIIVSTGQSTWVCVDGVGRALKREPTLNHIVMWIVRTYGDQASLTDVARALL